MTISPISTIECDRFRDFFTTVKTSHTNYLFMDWIDGHYHCGLVLQNNQRHQDEALAYGMAEYITWGCPRDPVTPVPVHPLTLVNNLWSTQTVGRFFWTSIVHRDRQTGIRRSCHRIPDTTSSRR